MSNSHSTGTPVSYEVDYLANGDRVVVISEPGAALRVERIELSAETKRSLTADVESIGPLYDVSELTVDGQSVRVRA